MNMLRKSPDPKCPVIRISGDLDHHSAENFREKLDKAIENEEIRDVILDFKNLRFMDSSGIGVLLGRYKVLHKKGGKIYVRNISKQADKIFRISGLYQVFIKID